ncbi:MAG: hypothetical protein K2L85_08435, partial [Paramuribaculum sp.]|nr:hypothetical protein [Paramuribaculum sp.]
IYTPESDVPLKNILETIKEKNNGSTVDYKKLPETELREYFGEILPDYDRDRVYTTDIRKVFSWYNELINAGITEFKDKEIAEDEAAEAADDAQTL